MKHAKITPVIKTRYRVSQGNYRPVSILPVISKILERLLCNQIIPFMYHFLSKYQCSFRKGFNAVYCLLAMLQKWKKAVNTKNALVLFFCTKPDSETIYSTENEELK